MAVIVLDVVEPGYAGPVVDVGDVGNKGEISRQNKAMAALATVSDGDAACGVAIAATPSQGGYVRVLVNGEAVTLRDGPSGSGACFFSSDGGGTVRSVSAIQAGDTLHWVGTVAGYQLETSDRIEFDYEES